ncbi:hypothetical protein D1AOALGA4SA_10587 [Olavius algarvensis Delta 1 endosymbiont]|nr:hypothetical protein D1AOALGA4SA_10587 [Olavius algarvensis Delta 1 endosymbiont]
MLRGCGIAAFGLRLSAHGDLKLGYQSSDICPLSSVIWSRVTGCGLIDCGT